LIRVKMLTAKAIYRSRQAPWNFSKKGSGKRSLSPAGDTR
jgi:hypothetical protein